MAAIDLNAARKARAALRETSGYEPHVILLEDDTYELPAEVPTEFAILAADGDLRGALRALLNGSGDQFIRTSTTDDIEELTDQISRLYGLGDDAGESSASAPSS